MYVSRKILLIALLLVLIYPFYLLAFQETSTGDGLLAEVKPSSPGPGDTVAISLSGYGFDLDTSVTRWFVNDRLVISAISHKVFNFRLGPVGQKTKVSVYVQTKSGRELSKTFVFDPAEIEIFWETDTSKPLSYKGKSLPSPGSTIKFTAWPYLVDQTGKRLDPSSLFYRWKNNDRLIENLSGLGQNTINLSTGVNDKQIKVSVEISNPADNLKTEKSLTINLVQPEILFYEKKPLEGINYGQAIIREYSLIDDETTIRAEPYFLASSRDLLRSWWTIDQTPAEGRSDDTMSITLRKKTGVSGSNRVTFSVQNRNSVISNSLIIKYGGNFLRF